MPRIASKLKSAISVTSCGWIRCRKDRTKAYAELQRGQVVLRSRGAAGASIPGGLIHEWAAVVFIPGATLRQTLGLMEDYDRDEEYYRPDVVKSKLLGRSGDEFHVFLRLKRKYAITAVFDNEYDVRYVVLSPTHAYSLSYSTRIVEVENAGEPGEHEDLVGNDRGLLWRLDSFWKFDERGDGIYVQCQAISLTRDIPTGLGWMVKPLVEKIPIESLRFTLTATRGAVMKQLSSPR